MTASQWTTLEKTVAHMTSEERERLAALLEQADQEKPLSKRDPLLGFFTSDSNFIDEVVEEALDARESDPLRSGH